MATWPQVVALLPKCAHILGVETFLPISIFAACCFSCHFSRTVMAAMSTASDMSCEHFSSKAALHSKTTPLHAKT